MSSEVTLGDRAQMGEQLARLLEEGFCVLLSTDEDSCSGSASKSWVEQDAGRAVIRRDDRHAVGRTVNETLADLAHNHPTRKCCGKCGEVKPLKFFGNDAAAPLGKSYRCRACDAERKRVPAASIRPGCKGPAKARAGKKGAKVSAAKPGARLIKPPKARKAKPAMAAKVSAGPAPRQAPSTARLTTIRPPAFTATPAPSPPAGAAPVPSAR